MPTRRPSRGRSSVNSPVRVSRNRMPRTRGAWQKRERAGTRAGPLACCARASGESARDQTLPLAAAGVGVVDVDLLLAHGLGDLALLGLHVLVEAHALLGHDALLDDGLLGVEH